MKKELKILNSVSSMFIFATGLLGPIYAVYVKNIGGDLITTGTAYGIFMIVAGILVAILSKWENHAKHKEIILISGYSLGLIGFIGYIFVDNPSHLFLVQLILGIASAIRVPVFDGIYSKNIEKGKHTFEWGVWESLSRFSEGLSAIIGASIAEFYGFTVLFVCMSVIAFIGVLTSTTLLIRKKIILGKKGLLGLLIPFRSK